MGSIKKIRKKYETPMHPWKRERIESERLLVNEFGLSNKKELWKMQSLLRGFTRQAKKLGRADTEQARKEQSQLLSKLTSLGLVGKDAKMSDVLTLTAKDILSRRLQTILYKKNMARSIKQARQFIIHGHVALSGSKVTVPSYMVKKEEETKIGFRQGSAISREDHPERPKEKKEDELKRKSSILKKEKTKEQEKEDKTEVKISEKKVEKVEDGKKLQTKEPGPEN